MYKGRKKLYVRKKDLSLKRGKNKRRKAEMQVAPSGNSFAQFTFNDLTA